MVQHKKINSEGFTLIEVLISVAIFSIGVLAVAAMQLSSVRGNAVARGVTEKVSLASDRMEELLSLPYTDTLLAAGEHSESAGSFTQATDGIDNDNDGQIDEAGESGFMSISWNVQDNTPLDRTKTIEVTVSRTTVLGGQRRITLTSIVGDES